MPSEEELAQARPAGNAAHAVPPESSGAAAPGAPEPDSTHGFRLSQNPRYPIGIQVLMALALATVACIGLYQVRNLVAPAFFALTLVLTVRPIQRALVRVGVPKWLSATITILVIILVLGGVVGLFAWTMTELPATLADYTNRFEALTNDVFDFLESRGFGTDRLQEEITKNFSVASVVGTLSSVFSSVSSVSSALLVIGVSVLFVTMDMGTMDARAKIVEEHDSQIFNSLAAFEGRVRQYWLVSSIFGAIVAVVDGIVLAALGLPMAPAWAMLSFITNYIPNIGFVIGLIPPALLGLVHSGPLTALWVIVAYSVINASIQGVFQPKVTGDAVGLSATATFASLLFWALVMGPLGTILAVPLTLFAKTILIDASPATRWLEVFLVPDDVASQKLEAGFYDEKDPAPDTFVDFAAAVLQQGLASQSDSRDMASMLRSWYRSRDRDEDPDPEWEDDEATEGPDAPADKARADATADEARRDAEPDAESATEPDAGPDAAGSRRRGK